MGDDEYQDDFDKYSSDFESFSEDEAGKSAGSKRAPVRESTYVPPNNLRITPPTIVFSQAPMSYHSKCMEGICKEQFVQTTSRFVSRGTTTYAETRTENRGIQAPSFLSDRALGSTGISIAEAILQITLSGQLDSVDETGSSTQARNKLMLKNLNTLKRQLIYNGTRESKIGFLMEKCVKTEQGMLALVAVKLLEEELSADNAVESANYPLDRLHMFQFVLLYCDNALNVVSVYSPSAKPRRHMPRDFALLAGNLNVPARVVLFSHTSSCCSDKEATTEGAAESQGVNITQPKKPFFTDHISIYTIPTVEGFSEVYFRPKDNYSPPAGRLIYRAVQRQGRSICVLGLIEHGILHSWEYNELTHEVSSQPQAQLGNGVLALSLHPITLSIQTLENSILLHLSNGIFLVLTFAINDFLDSEIKQALEPYRHMCADSTLKTVIPGTALAPNVYYNPMHTAVHSVKWLPQITVKGPSTTYNGITCILYTDSVMECFGTGLDDRIAVCVYKESSLSLVMGSLTEAILTSICRAIRE